MSPGEIRTGVVLAVGVIAIASDLHSRRIPNWLTMPTALAALVWTSMLAGWPGLASSAGGWLIGAAVFFPVFALRGMGAGDVKLLAAFGAWLGPLDALYLAIFTGIAGGVLALVVALWNGYLKTATRNVWVMLMRWRTEGLGPVPGLTLRDAASPKLAYAIPITVGAVCALWRW